MPSHVPVATDAAVLARVVSLVRSLEDERRRLALRLTEIERELARLGSTLDAQEPRLGDVSSSRSRRSA